MTSDTEFNILNIVLYIITVDAFWRQLSYQRLSTHLIKYRISACRVNIVNIYYSYFRNSSNIKKYILSHWVRWTRPI